MLHPATMDTQTQSATISFPSVINLNVGGQIYTTSLATLTKYSESMLGAMFSGRFAAQKDPNGNYFIDRDGALFRYILGFLRNGELQVPENFHEFGLLLKEAEFFQIPALRDAAKQQMKSRDGKPKSNKPKKTETITVYASEHPREQVESVSGRLLTLIEMFHIGDGENETFQCSLYGKQSDRTDDEQTAKITVKKKGRWIATNFVIDVAELHGFKFTGQSKYGYFILTRPIPQW